MDPNEWDMASILQSPYPAEDIVFSPTPDAAHSPLVLHHDSPNVVFDGPTLKSFRDRHRFLDSIYNSYPRPEQISAKALEEISKKADLPMGEVFAWFGDEKERRMKLFTNNSTLQFPPSPAQTSTRSNSTVTLGVSHYESSPGPMSQIDDIFSPPLVPAMSSQYPHIGVGGEEFASPSELFISPGTVEVSARRTERGRPPKPHFSRTTDSPFSGAKRQKCSTKYPCPDCDNVLTADRWSEHVKRVHFPDQVWECPKINQRNGKLCSSKPFFRPDNFATHLRGEHTCGAEEISQLKVTCKFRTRNLFHQMCGFCDDTFESREESIEHIKSHFREISERTNPPIDLGASEWKEKCKSDHKLKRGVHYRVSDGADHENSNRDGDYDDDGSSGQGSSDSQPHGHSQDEQNGQLPYNNNDSAGNDNGFYSNYTDYQQYSTAAQDTSQKSITRHLASQTCTFGLEGLALPFNSLRKLGNSSHGSVEEVTTANFKEKFARKSVVHMHNKLAPSSSMGHLRNELAILKNFNHPHLVRLIGAYIDTDYSYILMSPVAEQNLAHYMLSSQPSQSKNIIRWLGCLTSAMAYLHEHSVKHLDVKPQNILVKGSNILLADFGAAKTFFKQFIKGHESLTPTPTYCAPETVLHGSQEYSSDVFSLGCVFSEMITRYFGSSVQEFEDFRSKSGNKVFHLTISETKDWIIALSQYPISDRSTDCPEKMGQLIMDMLTEVPSERPNARILCDVFTRIDHGFCNSCCPVEGAPYKPADEDEDETSSTTPHNVDLNECARETTDSTLPSLSGVPSLESVASSAQCSDFSQTVETQNQYNNGSSHDDFCLYPPSDYNYSFEVSPNLGYGSGSFGNESLFSDLGESLVYPSLLRAPYSSRPTPCQLDDWSQEQVESPRISTNPEASKLSSRVAHPVVSYPNYIDPISKISHRYPPSRQPNLASQHPYSIQDNFAREESREKHRCTHPACGKLFKDLKAHMLTHQNERPEKCPVKSCEYHVRGFARKYDKNRHTLTHYKGTMVCGFCPGSGLAAEKSFNRADVFKRHLTSVHSVEQTLLNSRKRSATQLSSSSPITKSTSSQTTQTSSSTASKGNPISMPDAAANCSTCGLNFGNAQDFYEHLDDCLLKVVHRDELSAVAAAHQEAEHDQPGHEALRNNEPSAHSKFAEVVDEVVKEEVNDVDNDDFSMGSKSPRRENPQHIQSGGGMALSSKGRKKRKDYPSSLGCPASQMEMKKRVISVFDGPQHFSKDDLMLDMNYEVSVKPQDERVYVTDLDVQTMLLAKPFVRSDERGPLMVEDVTEFDLNILMNINAND